MSRIRSVRFDLDVHFDISSWTAAGSFRRALIKVVTYSGGFKVSYETKTTSVFDAYSPAQPEPRTYVRNGTFVVERRLVILLHGGCNAAPVA